jgi:hypothetical protein
MCIVLRDPVDANPESRDWETDPGLQSLSTLFRIFADYRRSVLQVHKSTLVLLAFESDQALRLKMESMKLQLLCKFHSMSIHHLTLY